MIKPNSFNQPEPDDQNSLNDYNEKRSRIEDRLANIIRKSFRFEEEVERYIHAYEEAAADCRGRTTPFLVFLIRVNFLRMRWLSQRRIEALIVPDYRDSQGKAKSMIELADNLPFWAAHILEENRGWLIDLRRNWYSNHSHFWIAHLKVNLLTLIFVVKLHWGMVSHRFQSRFRPLRKPRL